MKKIKNQVDDHRLTRAGMPLLNIKANITSNINKTIHRINMSTLFTIYVITMSLDYRSGGIGLK